MTTRSIVTSQPDVECDVCERRLLRGEQPDHFIAAGRRRIVCELCAPRAAHEGWMRETDSTPLTLPPMRPRRGRSLFDRFVGAARNGTAGSAPARSRAESGRTRPAPYDLLGGGSVAEPAESPVDSGAAPGVEHREPEEHRPTAGYLDRAVDVFNASEYPRRVAGVSRSLGEPLVSVRSAEHLASVVRIVVAWELSWYRYEVDLGEEPASAQAIGQGTELDQLEREEREGNAQAHTSGMLALTQ
ncbi:MAG TPA: hypothetical protein VH061_03115 [Solirubrobacteraceae bacterium]|jgi:hypothetical protein|nr:hypothetical protein [Solirubrobacteraceae bacterium]